MFSCCKRLALDIYNFEYSPRILVADSAKSITRVFDLAFRIDCWAHVDRNTDKNMKKHINDQEIRKAIKVDIDIFQNNVETDSFLVVARLMVTKWKEQLGESVVNNFF